MLDLLPSLCQFLNNRVPLNYFEDGAPENPDNVVFLVEYTGGNCDDYSGFRKIQINVRGDNNSQAKQNAWKIFRALNCEATDYQITTDDGRVILLKRLQTPTLKERDIKERVIYCFNIQALSLHDGDA